MMEQADISSLKLDAEKREGSNPSTPTNFSCICGKAYTTFSGLKTHQRCCLVYHKDSPPFVCVCGKEFPTPGLLSSHIKYCEQYCKLHGKEVRDPKKDAGNERRGWARGKTVDDPVYGEAIRKFREGSLKRIHSPEYVNPLYEWCHSPRPDWAKKKQSETRKQRYKEGSLVPDKGCGAGTKSSLYYKDSEYNFRSSYELIYALYLIMNGIDFSYESLRVHYNDKTYFCDFVVDGNPIEVKGCQSSKCKEESDAFKSAGYDLEFIFEEDIHKCIEELRDFIDTEKLLEDLDRCRRNKSRYVLHLS